ncbi:hypothetical protein H9P43_000809 [Blastocladiella emersonii ATCC 22665]|nr:hypothetical protein H9P43_000809 [Blastocladiella emersonii ATCC 22665]
MSRSVVQSRPHASRRKAAAEAAEAERTARREREETPEEREARLAAYAKADRIAKRFIIPAIIAIPILLFVALYAKYGNGGVAVATPLRKTKTKPVAVPTTSEKKRKAGKKDSSDKPVDPEFKKSAENAVRAAFEAAKLQKAAQGGEPVDGDDLVITEADPATEQAAADAAAGGDKTAKPMNNKQTEELARLMLEQLARFTGNEEIKFTFNDEEIKVGGGKAEADGNAEAASEDSDASEANEAASETDDGDVDLE